MFGGRTPQRIRAGLSRRARQANEIAGERSKKAAVDRKDHCLAGSKYDGCKARRTRISIATLLRNKTVNTQSIFRLLKNRLLDRGTSECAKTKKMQRGIITSSCIIALIQGGEARDYTSFFKLGTNRNVGLTSFDILDPADTPFHVTLRRVQH